MALKKYLIYVALIGLFFIGESVDSSPYERIASNSNLLEEMRALPSLTECGHVGLVDRIYGGRETGMQEFPWTALLLNENKSDPDNYDLGCGGSLINHYYVLTAAHCGGSNLKAVRLGEWNISSEIDTAELNKDIEAIVAPPVEDIKIVRQIIHPKYNESGVLENDIALLQLEIKVNYTPYISPICLPMDDEQRTNRYTDISAYVAGWGETEISISSDVKLLATVKIIDNDECKSRYLWVKNINITKKQICASAKEMDAGKGDSGAGLIVMNTVEGKIYAYIAGITSGGKTKATFRTGIYVHVGSYMEWIINNLGSIDNE